MESPLLSHLSSSNTSMTRGNMGQGPSSILDEFSHPTGVRIWGGTRESMMKVITTDGEAQERAIKETLEMLRVVEERMVEFCPTATTSIRGENLGLHDIVMFWTLGLHKAVEAAVGVKLICPDKFPLIFSWVGAQAEISEVREMKPDHDKIVGLLQFMRRNALQAPQSVNFCSYCMS